ncbi:MAG: amino acid adenylation domain-containing protein [Proteobacteria bacterium]|nr:amino acid adenylation domain-containing protein [Pseudomonadota bacterium]
MTTELPPSEAIDLAGKRRLAKRLLMHRARRARGLHPTAPGQRALWYLQALDPDSSAYNINSTVRLRAPFDPQALERALNLLVARHESLRSEFCIDAGEPVRRVLDAVRLRVDVQDGRRVDAAELQRRLDRAAGTPFDLARAPLLRVAAFVCGDADTVVSITVHHVIGDFWSMVQCMRELGELYAACIAGAPAARPPRPADYTDFVIDQENLLDGPSGERLWAFWRATLAGHAGRLPLPLDRPRPLLQDFRGGVVPVELDRAVLARLRELARDEGTTLFAALLAAYQGLLARLAGVDDIIVGVPMSGRTSARHAQTVGYFANLVPIRVRLPRGTTVRGLLREVRTQTLAAMAHQELPFALMVERLAASSDDRYAPLVQAAFMFEKSQHADQAGVLQFVGGQGDPEARLRIGPFSAEPVAVSHRSAQFDLNLMVEEVDGRLTGFLEFGSAVFDRATAAGIAARWMQFAAGMAAHADRRLDDVDLLLPGECATLLQAWNATQVPLPPRPDLHALFLAQATRHPDRPALRCDGTRLGYGALAAEAARVEQRLHAAGIAPGMLIGVALQRGPLLVAALLGILACGAAYLPLDLGHPPARLREILDEARTNGVVADAASAALLRPLTPQLLVLDDASPAARDARLAPLDAEGVAAARQGLAYVLYTSGSTGRPKGVAIRHASVVNVLLDIAQRIALGPSDRVLAATTICFDIAGLEIFMPLLHGAEIVLLRDNEGMDIVEALSGRDLSVAQATPSMWKLLLASGWRGRSDLTVLCGGEALEAELAARLAGCCKTLYNVYGPTETTIWSTLKQMPAGAHDPVRIGRPLANTEVYVLDEHLAPLPPRVPGDLYIGGAGLAIGYWRRPDLSAERFVPHPFDPTAGARLYRTGDRARWTHDGELEFLGRLDAQVKIRGHRIEPADIEAKLRTHPRVEACAVTASAADGAADLELVAHIVAQQALQTDALRAHLLALLPAYAVPLRYRLVDALPLTPNGKVDRNRLAADVPERAAVAPQAAAAGATPLEAQLCGIWSELLGSPVGPDDDFFELGGHSLMAITLMARIESALGIALPVAGLLRARTVRQLAQACTRLPQDGAQVLVTLRGTQVRGPVAVVVPGIGNSLIAYRHLADALPAALSVVGIDTVSLWHEAIDLPGAAARCADRLLAAWPDRPLRLFGHSFGGLLALATADELAERTGAFPDVVLLDTLAPDAAAAQAAAFGADDLDATLAWMRAAGRLPPADVPPTAGAHVDAWRRQLDAAARWRPRRYAGPVRIARALRPLDAARGFGIATQADGSDWRACCTGPLTVIDVDAADHFSIIEPPHVQTLLQRLHEHAGGTPVEA